MNSRNNISTDVAAVPAVVVIARLEDKLQGVGLRKVGRTLEVLWARSADVSDTEVGAFAAECGLRVGAAGKRVSEEERVVVAGFNSGATVFYQIEVPAVREEELASMVRLQTEARLPLEAQEMELAWRVGGIKAGRARITVVAARREQLEKFAGEVRSMEPRKILLDCEGLIKVWREFFGGSDRRSVVINVGRRSTQVCLAEGGLLSNAVRLDTGMEDFSFEEEPEAAERFTQDVRSVLDVFGYTRHEEMPIFVFSDDAATTRKIVGYLKSGRLKAHVSARDKKVGLSGAGDEELHEYRVAIGLGLMAMDRDAAGLDIFASVYKPSQRLGKRRWLYSRKAAGLVTAGMLLLLVLVFYVVDVARLSAMEKYLHETGANPDLRRLTERSKLMQAVARQRPDLLDLFSKINSVESKGIVLDSLDFRKGRPVSISGQSPGTDQLYEFREKLLGKKGVTEVKIRSAPEDSKSKKLKFTITFNYRNFSRKM